MQITDIKQIISNFFEKYKIPIIAISIVLSIVAIAIACLTIPRLINLSGKESKTEKSLNSTTKSLSKLESEFYNQQPSFGPRGPPGNTGSQGPPGGVFTAQGQLFNLNTDTSADVTQGIGVNSISFLNNPNKVTNQYWTLESNGLLKNKRSQKCLTANKTSNAIYMDTCNSLNKNQEWTWDDYGHITWSGGNPSMCLDYQKFNMTSQNSTKTYTKNKKNNNIVNKLTLKQCNSLGSTPSQKWYLG